MAKSKKTGNNEERPARVSTSRVVSANPEKKYKLGKPYRPQKDHNTSTWAAIQKALGNGSKTLAQIAEAVGDHTDFVGYMIRGGHLAPASDKE